MTATARKTAESVEVVEPCRVVGRLIKYVFNSILRGIDSRMQPLGLTGLQWEPLLLIHLGGLDTVAALARGSGVNCASMTRMLDRLEVKELVQRRRSDTDRRVVHVELTAQGKKVVRAIRPTVVEMLEMHLEGFTQAEVAQLTRLLERMLANGSRLADHDIESED